MPELLGYVLSRSSTNVARFQPIEKAENRIREGMLVVIMDSPTYKILGTIVRIEAFHEFYEVGEVWSEAIRQGRTLPEKVARKYVIAYVHLHGVIRDNGLKTIGKPPRPGAPVYEADNTILKSIYGFEPHSHEATPENIIVIGDLYGYHEESRALPAVLNLDNITMHLAILGVTGSGKSNTMGVIIEELGKKNSIKVGELHMKTIPIVVFDANGDYVDYYLDASVVPAYHVHRIVFPKAYLNNNVCISISSNAECRELKLDLNIYSENPALLAELVYALARGGTLEGLELQLDLLTRALEIAIRSSNVCRLGRGVTGVDVNCLLASDRGIRALRNIIENEERERRAHAQTACAVMRTLETFYEKVRKYEIVPEDSADATINPDFIDEISDPQEPKLVIFDFSADGAPGVELRVKQFVVGYFLSLVFDKFVQYKLRNENRVMLIAIEEAQNYAPNQAVYPIGYSVARNILAQVATQGRKFGLCLALITQRPSFVDPIIMSMVNTFVIHRIAPGDIGFVQQVTGGLPRHIRSRLATLETGLAIVVGQMNAFPSPVIVKVRRRVRHIAGSVSS